MKFYERMILLATINLSPTQQTRLQLLQRILENITSSLEFTGVDLNINLPIPEVGSPSTPTSLRSLLLSLLTKPVSITLPDGVPYVGTLIGVESDYVVLVENDGILKFIPFSKIVTVV